MKRIVVTESQARLIVDKLISEQTPQQINVKTLYAGTDANRITHAFLSKQYGLPNGAKHENYYYGANIKDVIAISADPNNVSNFLSVFKPINAYDPKPTYYFDYIEVNGQRLDTSGSKVFRFFEGDVYATHNGLLALARAMVNMGGAGANIKISFGSAKKGDAADKERIVGSVTFNSNKALNLSPILNTLADGLTSLAIDPKFSKGTTSYFGNYTIEQLKGYIKGLLTNIAIGTYGFIDPTQKDKIISDLKTKGLIMDVGVDLTNVINQLEKLRNVEDMIVDYETSSKPQYNTDKKNQLNRISDTFFPDLIEKLKQAYIANFKIYVQNYLPEDQARILPLIPNTRFVTMPLGNYHHFLFHSYNVGQAQTGTQLKTQNTIVGSGKINN